MDRWVQQDSMSPAIIPVDGLAPHGLFHVMHAGWRMYSPFIQRAMQQLDSSFGNLGFKAEILLLKISMHVVLPCLC